MTQIATQLQIRYGANKATKGENMPNARPAPHEQIFPIVMGFWQARAFAVATQLGLAEFLAEGVP